MGGEGVRQVRRGADQAEADEAGREERHEGDGEQRARLLQEVRQGEQDTGAEEPAEQGFVILLCLRLIKTN